MTNASRLQGENDASIKKKRTGIQMTFPQQNVYKLESFTL